VTRSSATASSALRFTTFCARCYSSSVRSVQHSRHVTASADSLVADAATSRPSVRAVAAVVAPAAAQLTVLAAALPLRLAALPAAATPVSV
ncbi:unnamed protein product, partial [Urochloa humidicola]